jgi:hypothetical protein
MQITRPDDPLEGASDDLRDWLATQPRIKRWWTQQMIVTGCKNPFDHMPAGRPAKRSMTTDVSTGERIDTINPEGQKRSQSIVRSLRDNGWSFESIYTLVFHFRPKGTRWITDQWDPDYVFVRAWEQAAKPLKTLQPKTGEYRVESFITAHVWAYIRRNPGMGTKEMRRDWDILLPGMRGRKRNGAIDRARESLEADGLIRIEVQKFGKRAAYSFVDEATGEIIEHSETEADITRLVPVLDSTRRVAFRRLSSPRRAPLDEGVQ